MAHSYKSVHAASLVVDVKDFGMISLTWYYFTTAARCWLPGCFSLDPLQGPGLFGAIGFANHYEPSESGNQFTYVTDEAGSGGKRSYCGQKYNPKGWFTLQDPITDNYGRINAIQDSSAGNTVDIQCSIGSGQYAIDCTPEAALNWIQESDNTYTISVTLV